jgi:DNA-binding NtrC family response regulator
VLDVDMPAMNGFEVLRRVRQAHPNLPVLMLTADDTAQSAVRALQRGAFNYLTKARLQDSEAFALVVEQAVGFGQLQRRARRLEERAELRDRFELIIGESTRMREVFTTVERVAPLDINVLLLGESGTGKELLARAIHARSSRAQGPFVALNCGALPESLIDSELFGHEKGAFTGAVSAHAGAFERANGGTLFLDEIGEISPAAQLRLLRVLQEREIQRVGGRRAIPVDVRLVAATLVDLEASIETKDGFRPDLYYRINVVSIEIPPLRQRMDDVPLIAAHLLRKHCDKMQRPVPEVSPQYLDALMSYHWPGNVRELENAIQSSLALGDTERLDANALPRTVRSNRTVQGQPLDLANDTAWAKVIPFSEARSLLVERFERNYLIRVLRETRGNLSAAARKAGLDRSNFRRAMKRCNVNRSDYEEPGDKSATRST